MYSQSVLISSNLLTHTYSHIRFHRENVKQYKAMMAILVKAHFTGGSIAWRQERGKRISISLLVALGIDLHCYLPQYSYVLRSKTSQNKHAVIL